LQNVTSLLSSARGVEQTTNLSKYFQYDKFGRLPRLRCTAPIAKRHGERLWQFFLRVLREGGNNGIEWQDSNYGVFQVVDEYALTRGWASMKPGKKLVSWDNMQRQMRLDIFVIVLN